MNIQEEVQKIHAQFGVSEMANYKIEQLVEKAIKEAQQWIPISEKKLPEIKFESEGLFYSEYVLVKIKGYKHPFVAVYCESNGESRFDFIYTAIDNEMLDKQEDITHFRLIELE